MARREKTVEDQGVPWMKTRVCVGCVWFDGEEDGRRAYFISQLSWWKVDGRGIVVGVVVLGDDIAVRGEEVYAGENSCMFPLCCFRSYGISVCVGR